MRPVQETMDTGVIRSRARLPSPPAYWSFSALKQIERCPLQYALQRAEYADLWIGKGYPPLPTAAALFGNVVHGALELLVSALSTSGVDTSNAAQTSDVLRGLGGLSTVVESAIAAQLAPLDMNPRLEPDRRRRIARELQNQAPEARAQVQTIVSRTSFVTRRSRAAAQARPATSGRLPLGDGSHAEARLISEELRLLGRIDLLTVQDREVRIVDYKTGAESPSHAEQMRLYALLWERDHVANPKVSAVSDLILAYSDKDVHVEVPARDQLEKLALALQTRIASADAELEAGTPTAAPTLENCEWCPVRQLCGAYWQFVAPKISELSDGEWFDCEIIIGARNGQRSWWAKSVEGQSVDLMVRTPTQVPPFSEGDRVRVLGVRHEVDPEISFPITVLSTSSEVFKMTTG